MKLGRRSFLKLLGVAPAAAAVAAKGVEPTKDVDSVKPTESPRDVTVRDGIRPNTYFDEKLFKKLLRLPNVIRVDKPCFLYQGKTYAVATQMYSSPRQLYRAIKTMPCTVALFSCTKLINTEIRDGQAQAHLKHHRYLRFAQIWKRPSDYMRWVEGEQRQRARKKLDEKRWVFRRKS